MLIFPEISSSEEGPHIASAYKVHLSLQLHSSADADS
jgi:hypothetical protein